MTVSVVFIQHRDWQLGQTSYQGMHKYRSIRSALPQKLHSALPHATGTPGPGPTPGRGDLTATSFALLCFALLCFAFMACPSETHTCKSY
jgi:hypothetical protein